MDGAWLEVSFRQIPLTPLESALHGVALYSNPAWNLLGDQYHKKMQEAWVKHNRIHEASKQLTAFDIFAGVAEGMPKTVRSVIPFSRLAQYGDFAYHTEDTVYRSSAQWRDSNLHLFRIKADDHGQGVGDFRENVVCLEEWLSESVEAMFRRLQTNPCNVTAEHTGEVTRDETPLNLSMLERSMTNGSNGYDSPFDLPSPLENWMSQLQTKPPHPISATVAAREHSASWANIVLDMYPKFLDTLRGCRSELGGKLVKNVPLAIDYKDVLRKPVTPLETYAICPPPTHKGPLEATDLLSNVILWDRVSAQSVKEIWMKSCCRDNLLDSVFPTLAAILKQGAISLSTAYLADEALLKYRLELGFQQSAKRVQQGTSNPNNQGGKFRARNNCSAERRFRPPNHWRHQVFTGESQNNYRKTLIMDDNHKHKEQEVEKLKSSQEMFPHVNAGGKAEVNATYWPPNNNTLGFRLPWNVVAQLPTPRIWTNVQLNSPGSIQVHQPQYLQPNRKQFHVSGNHVHRKNPKSAPSTTAKVVEILARPASKEVPAPHQGHRDAEGEADTSPPSSGNPIPVHIGCNNSLKKPSKRESTLKLLTTSLEEEKKGRS